MRTDIRDVKDMNGLIAYFAEKLNWKIDLDSFDYIEDIAYDFDASDIGLKEEAFAKIKSLRQLPPLVDGQKWGIFCVEFDSKKFEITALRKILSGLIPKRRNSVDHAVWDQKDLLFLCFWGADNSRTIGIAHFADSDAGLPQLKVIYCAPAVEDFTQINKFETKLSNLKWPKEYVEVHHDLWRDEWSSAFTTGFRETIRDASTLTLQLAIAAQGIRNRILEIMEVETANGYVHLLFQKFRDTLIHDMTETQFADMYAQTVVYGLFSARCMDETQENFSASEAIECIPNTNPFLKNLMKECFGTRNNSLLSFDELEIGEVVDLLSHTNTEAIIQDFGRMTGGGREDPVIHFYEEFLTAYDKQQKVQRGVYYTPQPVVNFIVRAVDHILKTEFGYEDGLATTATKKIKVKRKSERKYNGVYTEVEDTVEVPAVQVLDPATGTGTFIRQTILQIYENFKEKNKGISKEELKKAWNDYVPKYLLTRLNAFELMMAPYAVAHMKLAMVLRDTGYEFNDDSRLNVFLTNTLEEPGDTDNQISLFSDPLAVESIEANKVKKNEGICVIMGNPPYSGASANKSKWIMTLMEDYKKEPGRDIPLQERNSKFVNDDYIKFLRYAQNALKSNEKGIVAFINPHGYLDAPTFRGVRWSLLQEYDKVFILNLHGNANRGEKCPDGSQDENVFDIQQGVSINLLIKENHKRKNSPCVMYADVYGSRETKYDRLNRWSIKNIDWTLVHPQEPFYFMVPRNDELLTEYMKGIKLSELFQSSVMGFQTHRDKFAVAFTKEELTKRIKEFMDPSITDDAILAKYGIKNTRDWNVTGARNRIRSQKIEDYITECLYRPFDIRWCYFEYAVMDFPRRELLDNVLKKDNLCLLVPRQQATTGFKHALVSIYPAVDTAISTASREANQVFPLYTYGTEALQGSSSKKQNNLSVKAVEKLLTKTNLKLGEIKSEEFSTPEEVFFYIYAILYSDEYRKKYSECIKSDYPYIPIPQNANQYREFAEIGEKLVKVHCLQIEDPRIEKYCFSGENRVVDAVRFADETVFINRSAFFCGVDEEIWNYQIGGHIPAQLWLKTRKGFELTSSDIVTYRKVLYAIELTRRLVRSISFES